MSSPELMFIGICLIAFVLFISMFIDIKWDNEFIDEVSKECERSKKQIDFKVGPE